MTTDTLPPATHNLPPLPTPESLEAALRAEHAHIFDRHAAFKDAMTRAPETIADDDTAQKAADMAKQLKSGMDVAEAKRVDAKKPFDELAAVPHGLFGKVRDDFKNWRLTIIGRADAYQAAKRDAERKRLADEAAKKRAEAEALAQQGQMEAAAEVAEKAAVVEQKAAAPSAGATTGSLGGSFGSRTTWTFSIEDKSKIPLEYMEPNLVAIGAAKNAANAAKKLEKGKVYTDIIPGVRIYETTSTTAR
jgi:hypothetical protein